MTFSRTAVLLSTLLASGCSPQIDPPPAPEGALAANLGTAADGRTVLSWLEPAAVGHRLRFARLDGSRWSEPITIREGTDFFANWADLPGVVADDGTLYAHWLEELGDETYAYGARFATSVDGGRQWSEPSWLHDDTSPTEHGFVSYAATRAGPRAFWLDGRAMLEDGDPMQLRTALLENGEVPASTLLDSRVCECCATDAAVTDAGAVVVYRDRSEDEIRDIRILIQEGAGWSAPLTVADDGWQITGCPVNGPAVDASGTLVAVVWFTAADNDPRVLAAISADGGRSFAEPVTVDDERPVGRVDLTIDADHRIWLTWMATGGKIMLQSMLASGELGERAELATVTSQRASGFPRLIAEAERLVIVWRSAKTLQATAKKL